MVLTSPMVLTQTHGIVSVLLNHKHTREPSVARMRNFFARNYVISRLMGVSSVDKNVNQFNLT